MKEYKTMIERVSLVREKADFNKVQIKGSKDAFKFVRQFFEGDIDIYESMFLVLLNRRNDTIGYAKISQGGVVGTVVDVKLILKYCVDSLASSAILCHNHPSGNLEPSDNDLRTTRQVKDALRMMDVTLCDHLIVTDTLYYSFADEGRL